ncbi:MAG: hypothetical protein ACRD0A_03160, partial [Acidimicrobiales bacterium]
MAAASRAFRFQPLDVFLNGALIDTPVTADDIAALYDLIRDVESRLGGEVTSEGFGAAADIAPLVDAGDIDVVREELRGRFGPRVDDPDFVIGFFGGLGPGRFLNLVDGLGGTSELPVLLRGFARFTTDGRSAPSFASGADIDQLDTILNTDPTLTFGEDFLVAAGNRALEQDVGWRVAGVHPNNGDPVYVFEVAPELDRVMGAVARNPTASAHVLLGTTTFTADFPAGMMGVPPAIHQERTVSNVVILLRTGNQDQVPPLEPEGIAAVIRAGTSPELADASSPLHNNALVEVAEALDDNLVRLPVYKPQGMGGAPIFDQRAEHRLDPYMAEVVAEVYCDNTSRFAEAADVVPGSLADTDPVTGQDGGGRSRLNRAHVSTILESVLELDDDRLLARVLEATRVEVHATILEATGWNIPQSEGVSVLDDAVALSGTFVAAYDTAHDSRVFAEIAAAVERQQQLSDAVTVGGTLLATIAGPAGALPAGLLELGAGAIGSALAPDVALSPDQAGEFFDHLAAGTGARSNIGDLVVYYRYESALADPTAPGAQDFVTAMNDLLPDYM